jgi:hypothetical protein
MQEHGFWRSCGIPVAVSVGALTATNALWNHAPESLGLKFVPTSLVVDLLAGSCLALFLLRRALRAGRVTPGELGLDLSGWTSPRRLAGLALIVVCGYGQFAWFGPAAASWGDYSFWYVFLLMASLAEVLVFVGVVFCLGEAWLRRRGFGPVTAAALPAAFACVAYGLYHFSHEPRFQAYVLATMPELFLVLLYFVLTRNFTLMLALHNAFAAVAFTREQYSPENPLPADQVSQLREPQVVVVVLFCFLVPFLLLHWLEWRAQPPARKASL